MQGLFQAIVLREELFISGVQSSPLPPSQSPPNQLPVFTGSVSSSVRSAYFSTVDIWNVRTFTLLMCGRSELPYRQAHSWTGHMYYSSWDVYRGQCTWLCQRSVNTCTKLLRCLKEGLLLGLVGPLPWQVRWAVTRSCVSTPKQPLKMYESPSPSGQAEDHPTTHQLQLTPPPPPTTATRYTCQFTPVTCLRHITVTSISWGWKKTTVTRLPSAVRFWCCRVITPTLMFTANALCNWQSL